MYVKIDKVSKKIDEMNKNIKNVRKKITYLLCFLLVDNENC